MLDIAEKRFGVFGYEMEEFRMVLMKIVEKVKVLIKLELILFKFIDV